MTFPQKPALEAMVEPNSIAEELREKLGISEIGASWDVKVRFRAHFRTNFESHIDSPRRLWPSAPYGLLSAGN
jgi:hypothetical protein